MPKDLLRLWPKSSRGKLALKRPSGSLERHSVYCTFQSVIQLNKCEDDATIYSSSLIRQS